MLWYIQRPKRPTAQTAPNQISIVFSNTQATSTKRHAKALRRTGISSSSANCTKAVKSALKKESAIEVTLRDA